MTDHTEHDLRALLAERGWLERLALRLVRDPAAAEDLTQETLLRAIDRGPALGGSGGASDARRRGWLSTVLRRLALQRHRAERRRRDRERAWAPFEEGDAESLRRAQLRRDLVDEVLRLPEPERTAVTLRYLEGRSYAEIAAAQSIGEPAARKRVSRGIARLRERLDEQHGGRAAWTALVLPWIGQDTTTAATATAVAAAPKAGAWILTMKTQTKLAAAAAAILAAGMLAWTQLGRTPDASEGAQRDERADARLAGGAELEGVDAEAAAAERAVAPAPDAPAEVASLPAFPDRPAETTGTLALRLVWPDGSPGVGVSAELFAWGDPFPLLRALQYVADDEGRLVAEGLTAGRVSAYVGRSSGGTYDVRTGSVTSATIELEAGFTVIGTVTAPDGAPVQGAEIALSDYGNDMQAKAVGETGPDGRYSIRGVENGRSVSARATGFAPSAATRVGKHPEGTEHVVDLVLAPGGAHLAGTVVDEQGTPLSGAFVRVSPALRETPEDRVKLHPIEIWTDDAGEFEVPDAGAGRLDVWVRTEVHRPHHAILDLEPGERRNFEFVMKRGGVLTGRVLRADGSPASGATIAIGERYDRTIPRGISVRTRADGSFELAGLKSGRQPVRVHEADEGKYEGTVVIPADETIYEEFQLVRGRRVTGRVVDARDEPLEDWSVATLVGSGLIDRRTETAADGSFTLRDVREGAVEVHAMAPGKLFDGVVAKARIEDASALIRIPDEALPTAAFRLRVLADGRAPDPAATVGWRSVTGVRRPTILTGNWSGGAGFGTSEAFTDANGEVELDGLRPGPCLITVALDGFAVARWTGSLSADETQDFGVVELTRGGRVAVQLVAGAGELEHGLPGHVMLRDEAGRMVTFIDLEQGEGVTDPIAPGTYSVSTFWNVLLSGPTTVDVADGATTTFRATCEPGEAVVVDIDSPIEGLLQRGFLVEVRDASGRLERRVEDMLMPGLPTRITIGGLAHGTWTIRIEADGGRSGEVTVDAAPGAPQRVPAKIELR